MNQLGKEAMLALLKTYEEAYYSGEAKVTDEEYDTLKAIYVEQYGEYDFVPNEGEVEHFVKTKHLYPLKSLDKVQVTDENKLRTELERLWPVIIQPKFDGLSIEIQYIDNKLKFITRGNGETGDDVTAQCMQIPDIEHLSKLFTSDKQSYRAEILMTHDDLKRINKQREENGADLLSNCRNGAAGMLRNIDVSKIDGLTVMLYEELNSTKSESDDIDDMKLLEQDYDSDNIRVTPYKKPKDIDEAIKFLNTLEETREVIDYDIDGWVVKSNKENSLELFGGYTGHHPKNAFAVKGEAKGAWTPIKSITWQVGKESITPVAELEPVEIDGSIISRATLHNVSFLKAMNLNYIYYKGKDNPVSKVKVIKANDVIPRIIEVKHPMEMTKPILSESNITIESCTAPSKCPVCGADTTIKESDSDSEILVCTGDFCTAKLQARMLQMCSRDGLDITGMSEGTAKKFLDTYDMYTPCAILTATKEHILELDGFAEKSAQKLYDAIQKAIKEQPINKVMYASAVPLIGKSASKDICEHYSIEELTVIYKSSDEEAIKSLLKVKDIGETTAKSLIANKATVKELYDSIAKVTDIKSNKPQVSNQFVFCITGQREPFKTIIEENGHKVSSSVSKKTTALVNANNEQSSKAIKAMELNLPIITTVEELNSFIQKNN